MLIDNYNRSFSYLRLSITDICNFKCKYCVPSNIKFKKKFFLSCDEIYNLISVLIDLGVNKVRITGGEPTVRKDFIIIGKIISSFSSIKNLVFTTNGYNLYEISDSLKYAGYNGINISLDTLNYIKFFKITGKNSFDKVYKGILKSIRLGLNVKLNVVLSKFFFYDDFELFYSLLNYKNFTIRFIDQMNFYPLNNLNNYKLNTKFLLSFLKNNGWLCLLDKKKNSGPARIFYNNNFLGKIGIINPYSYLFCIDCNRIRVDSLGNLFLCLFGKKSYSIRSYLLSSSNRLFLKNFLIEKIKFKSFSHLLNENKFGLINSFSSIGG